MDDNRPMGGPFLRRRNRFNQQRFVFSEMNVKVTILRVVHSGYNAKG